MKFPITLLFFCLYNEFYITVWNGFHSGSDNCIYQNNPFPYYYTIHPPPGIPIPYPKGMVPPIPHKPG